MRARRKLIEVALPLSEINDASAYDKMPGIGAHPKGIHHWWARLPLPIARAVLFASVVDDPGDWPEKWPTEETQNAERERLFNILRNMMAKKLHEAPEIYGEAHREMLKHCDGVLPSLFDPFSGGGSIPLEANRLGFSSNAADLNPVAVLLNKCNLEIVPKWARQSPINGAEKDALANKESWVRAKGLSSDIKFYGGVVEKRAVEKIGHLYPRVDLSGVTNAQQADVIAWIWARTVASPDPSAEGKHVPLLSTFWLSSKKGKLAWLEPKINREMGSFTFDVASGVPEDAATVAAGTKVGRAGFRCLLTNAPITFEYIRGEGQAGRIGTRMVAVVADGGRGRTYLKVDDEQIRVAASAVPVDYPDTDLPDKALGFRVQNYGIRKHSQMFSPRQLVSMVTISDEVRGVVKDIQSDAVLSGFSEEDSSDYARDIATFLALALDRCADFNCGWSTWLASGQQQKHLFTRQAVPPVWDFAEANIFGKKAICWHNAVEITADAVSSICVDDEQVGTARQVDAASGVQTFQNVIVSTDPPYYDNIGYAALSDFFYVWLRRTIGKLYPDLFATVLVPKLPELTASAALFDGNREAAKAHFESGFRQAFTHLRDKMDSRFPLTVYYAFKQDEDDDREKGDRVDLSTGWETLLAALVTSGFQITATWPVRASQAWRIRAVDSNALASYIVLACRSRDEDATLISRSELRSELRSVLPAALRHLQQGNIAPVDLAQAAIGPGMSVYTRYAKILDAEGKAVSVREALALINLTLDEVLTEQEGDFDADSRWAVAWFEQYGFSEGEYGVAETLSKAKNNSIRGLVERRLIASKGGKVHLFQPSELNAEWDPSDQHITAWEMVHQFIRVIEGQGERAAGSLMAKIGTRAEVARELAYRLYTLCERKKRAREALSYNALVQSWPEIVRFANDFASIQPTQMNMLG